MGFKIVYGDICRMQGDCIVNSLGLRLSSMGQVCWDIKEKAESEEINALINSDKCGEFFDIFVTDGGKLKCKRVIHIVAPYKCYDDYELTSLRRAFTDVINKAIELEMKTILIPFIGTGANGYSRSDVYRASTEVGFLYSENENIDISVVLYNKEQPRPKRNRELNIRSIDAFNRRNGTTYEPAYFDTIEFKSYSLNRIFSRIKENEMFKYSKLNYEVNNPMNFIEAYLDYNSIPKRFLFQNFLGKDECSRARRGVKRLSKPEIYRAAIALGLNRTIFLQLMTLAGYSFSPLSELDMWMYDYYMYGEIEENMATFQDKYYDDLPILKEIFEW